MALPQRVKGFWYFYEKESTDIDLMCNNECITEIKNNNTFNLYFRGATIVSWFWKNVKTNILKAFPKGSISLALYRYLTIRK